ncbi:DUF4247 domain-containing protein [Streptomyces peucetius]|uniref:DUF4247 domain-containing protein n=1 Tax=Streptomyces peucetius TaxID=1950 RepID=A0ABY6I1E3_STRPE|nr:DUF4247 domain-containing protein [Streptomyces peucetius]UYQ60793.1 DUF4247 domain-containing protein [Streptomyces peucetius]
MKTARIISVTLLALVALTACGDDPEDSNSVPSSWIRQQYSGSSVGYVDSSDATTEVAKEIDGHTAAHDRIDDDGKVFLRYRDDIVAITPLERGSRIEIDDYRTGYRRWQSSVRSVWPDPDSDSFRGGGPGSGK